MHDLIDAHVATALKLRERGPGRLAALTEEIRELLLRHILNHGCKLPEEEIRRLLDLDVRLNSQGLENWLDHTGEGR